MPAASSGDMTDASPSMSATAAGAPMALGVAATRGDGGERICVLMVPAVEHRFGLVNRLPVTIEWLSDNGSCYVAGETRSFARDIGLEPRTTALRSPQGNGNAGRF